MVGLDGRGVLHRRPNVARFGAREVETDIPLLTGHSIPESGAVSWTARGQPLKIDENAPYDDLRDEAEVRETDCNWRTMPDHVRTMVERIDHEVREMSRRLCRLLPP